METSLQFPNASAQMHQVKNLPRPRPPNIYDARKQIELLSETTQQRVKWNNGVEIVPWRHPRLAGLSDSPSLILNGGHRYYKYVGNSI